MKIAILVGRASPVSMTEDTSDSRQERAVALSRALAARGHRITVYSRRSGPGLPEHVCPDAHVEVEHLPVGPAVPLSGKDLLECLPRLAEQLACRWADDRPDVVHTIGWDCAVAATAALRHMGALPMVHEGLADPVASAAWDTRGALFEVRLRHLRYALVRNCQAALAECPQEADSLVRMGVGRHRVAVVPPGVDTDLFAPVDEPSSHASGGRLLCLDAQDGVAQRAGTETVIAAMAGLPATARLRVAGDPRPGMGRSTAAGRIRYLGAVPFGQVPGLLHACDVLLTAAGDAPAGTVVLEAMACGVPVVGSDVGAPHDLVVDQVTGLLVPPGRPDLLGRAVLGLLRDPARRQALGVAGADRARSRHAWPRIAAETERVYGALAVGHALARSPGPDA